MERAQAEGFARAWVTAWNDRDLEAILAHYDDAVVFHSPRISNILGGSDAFVSGKPALRDYWTKALARAPSLYFALDKVFIGSDAVTLLYTNHRDQSVTETFVFGPAGTIIEAIAAYE